MNSSRTSSSGSMSKSQRRSAEPRDRGGGSGKSTSTHGNAARKRKGNRENEEYLDAKRLEIEAALDAQRRRRAEVEIPVLLSDVSIADSRPSYAPSGSQEPSGSEAKRSVQQFISSSVQTPRGLVFDEATRRYYKRDNDYAVKLSGAHQRQRQQLSFSETPIGEELIGLLNERQSSHRMSWGGSFFSYCNQMEARRLVINASHLDLRIPSTAPCSVHPIFGRVIIGNENEIYNASSPRAQWRRVLTNPASRPPTDTASVPLDVSWCPSNAKPLLLQLARRSDETTFIYLTVFQDDILSENSRGTMAYSRDLYSQRVDSLASSILTCTSWSRSSGAIYAGGNGDLYRFDINSGIYHSILRSNGQTNCVREYEGDKVLVGMRNGKIYSCDTRTAGHFNVDRKSGCIKTRGLIELGATRRAVDHTLMLNDGMSLIAQDIVNNIVMFDVRSPGAVVKILRDGSKPERIRKRGFWVSPDRDFVIVPTETGVEIMDPWCADSPSLRSIGLPREGGAIDASINAFNVSKNLAAPCDFCGDEWSLSMILGSSYTGVSTMQLMEIGFLAM